MKKIIIILIIFFICLHLSYASKMEFDSTKNESRKGISIDKNQLIPLEKLKGNYYDITTKTLIIPLLDLKLEHKNKLYHKNKLIFEPDSNFTYCIFDVFKEKNILITSITGERVYYSIDQHSLLKYEVIIINLEEPENLYWINLKGYELIDIDLVNGIVYVLDRENNELKLKLIKIK